MSEQGKVRGPGSRTRADWEQLVTAYERREGTREAFCAAAGISATSLDYWRRKLRREASGLADFIELPAAKARGAEAASGTLELELALGDGVVLRLRR